MASRYESRLRALEGRLAAPAALVDRVAALLNNLELRDPGGAASVIRQLGFADRLHEIVAASEAHARAHNTGTPCGRQCPAESPAHPSRLKEVHRDVSP